MVSLNIILDVQVVLSRFVFVIDKNIEETEDYPPVNGPGYHAKGKPQSV